MDKDTLQDITKQEQEVAEQVVATLLQKLEVEADFDIAPTDGVFSITLDTQESGIVIGYRGEVLEGMQLVLALMIAKKAGRYIPLSVDVGEYKKKRKEYLTQLVMQIKERVIEEQQEQSLPNLKSWERREVHMLLKEDPDVMTESIGEGRDRTLVIKLKN